MKILFFAGELSGRLNAANKIVMQLAQQLSLDGSSCFVFGINNDENINKNDNNFNVVAVKRSCNPFASLEEYVNKTNSNRKEAVRKYMLSHPVNALKIAYGYKNAKFMQKSITAEDSQILQHYIKDNDFDLLITLQEPPWVVKLANRLNLPVVIYQLDPFGLHELYTDNLFKKIDTELYNFNIAKHIFTTPALYRQYKSHKDYRRFINKVTAVEFPNIRNISIINQNAINFDNSFINIVYCGIMEDSYRSPKSFLELFSKILLLNNKLRVYFIGDVTSRYLVEYAEKYPDNIIVKRPVDLTTATAIQNDADILLNIGNVITNQVPSKIFDYFSLGKPVFSTCKLQDCPSKEYLNKYPLSYIYNEYNSSCSVEAAADFLQKSKGKRLDYNNIAKIYNDCTLEYVGNVFKDKLCLNGDGDEKDC